MTTRRMASGRAGFLRIGFTAAIGFSVPCPLLKEITAVLPDVDLDLHELVTGEQIHGLQTCELDLGLARPPFDTDVFGSRCCNASPRCLPSRRVTRPLYSRAWVGMPCRADSTTPKTAAIHTPGIHGVTNR